MDGVIKSGLQKKTNLIADEPEQFWKIVRARVYFTVSRKNILKLLKLYKP